MLWWTIRKLQSSNADERLAAVSKLGESSDPRAIQALATALEDRHPAVFKAAIDALKSKGTEDASSALGAAACDKLSWYHDDQIPITDLLILALKHPKKEIRLKAISNFLYLRNIDSRLIDALGASLNDIDKEVQSTAAFKLADLKDARGIKSLCTALKDPGRTENRWAFIRALGELGNPEAKGALASMMNDPNKEIRYDTALALGKLGDIRAVDPLCVALTTTTDSHESKEIVEVLGKLRNNQAILPLCTALKHTDVEVRLATIEALRKIGDARAVNPLGEALKLCAANHEYKDNEILAEIAKTLGQLGDTRAIEPLCIAYEGKGYNPFYQAFLDATADAVVKICGKRAFLHLFTALKSDDWGTRKMVATVLGRIGDVTAVEPLCIALKDDTDQVRQAAMESLGRLPSARSVETLCKAFLDGESVAGPLRKSGWYPEQTKRMEIVEKNWGLGLTLGFPEAIDPAVRVLLENGYLCPYGNDEDIRLHNTVPHSALTFELADLIEAALKHPKWENESGKWPRHRYYKVEASNKAVEELCRQVSPVTTNILHLIKDKTNWEIHRTDHCETESWIDEVDFQSQRMAAIKELERRGNPPYQPKAYLKD